MFDRTSQQATQRAPGRPSGSGATLLLALALAPALSGCVGLVLGGAAAGAAVGASASHDRRGESTFLDDQKIDFDAMAALGSDKLLQGRGRFKVTSYNYIVLLLGQGESQATVNRAAWVLSQRPKVQKVINEMTVGPTIGLMQQGEDTVITSRAKLALLDIQLPDFDPTRIKVVTEDGAVYLMGLVTPEEGDAAAEKIRFIPGVKRVVKLFEQPPTPQPPAAT